jgi:ubiquinone/menaquinone biosynthesis C-methylase UbiE
MGKSKLGLPLEYSKLADYYDAFSQGDACSKNRTIERILKKHKVETVLDLTCGTGSQVFSLAKRGYKVTGADFSKPLLKIARKKAQKEAIDVRLIKGDMRTIKVGHFDAVITIFNAVGHLTKADFEKTMRNINSNLKDGGLYVFDIFNLDAMTDLVVRNLAMDVRKTVNHTQIQNIQYSTLDRECGLLTSYDQFSIQEGSKKPKAMKGEFTLQIYTAKELRDMLVRSGFETLGQYGIDGSRFSEKKTENILTVAKKERSNIKSLRAPQMGQATPSHR